MIVLQVSHLCIELHLLYMALLISEDWGVPCMVQGGGVGDHRDGGRGGMLDNRLSLGGEGGDQEREEDLDRREMRRMIRIRRLTAHMLSLVDTLCN